MERIKYPKSLLLEYENEYLKMEHSFFNDYGFQIGNINRIIKNIDKMKTNHNIHVKK